MTIMTIIKKILFFVVLSIYLHSSRSLINPCKRYEKETDFHEMRKDCVTHLKTDDIYIHTSNTDDYLFCCRTHPIKNAFFKK